jgi:hypothetical protein
MGNGKEFWSLANAITAFAIAQSLAFAYALAGEDGEKIQKMRNFVSPAIVAAGIAFCVAVWFCHYAHTKLLRSAKDQGSSGSPNACLLTITMIGRVAAIAGYAAFAVKLLSDAAVVN